MEGLRVELQSEEGEVKWVLFASGKRGSVGKLVAEERLQEGFVKSLTLRPKYRGFGTGLALLEQCKAFFRDERGLDSVALEAEEDMARFGKLVALYEQAGFEVEGSSFKLLYHGDETYRVVPMRCILRCDAASASRQFAFDMGLECRTESRSRMTVFEALTQYNKMSKAVLAMRLAENSGHPEWIQFLMLVNQLACLESNWKWGALNGRKSHHSNRSTTWVAEFLVDISAILPQEDWELLQKHGAPLGASPSLSKGMGLEHVQPIWSPDEYLFNVIQRNECLLPPVASQMIRFCHMAVLLENGTYNELLEPRDQTTLHWIRLFARLTADVNNIKVDDIASCEQDVERARRLVEKFCPEPWVF